jgi:hypothetical protein
MSLRQITQENVKSIGLPESFIGKFYVKVQDRCEVCDTFKEAMHTWDQMRFSVAYDLAMEGEMMYE